MEQETQTEVAEGIVPGGPNDLSQHEVEADPDDFFGAVADEGESQVLPEVPEPTPTPTPEPTPEPEPEPETVHGIAEEDAGPPVEPQPRKSGQITRPYKVFIQRRLTEPVLQSLLDRTSDGEELVAYIELGEIPARNRENALRLSFHQYRDEIGEEAVLVPTPARGWQPSRVRPKQRFEEDVEIDGE